MVEETFIWTEIRKNQQALIPFLKGQDARHGYSECPPALNLIAPLIIAPPIITRPRRPGFKGHEFMIILEPYLGPLFGTPMDPFGPIKT